MWRVDLSTPGQWLIYYLPMNLSRICFPESTHSSLNCDLSFYLLLIILQTSQFIFWFHIFAIGHLSSVKSICDARFQALKALNWTKSALRWHILQNGRFSLFKPRCNFVKNRQSFSPVSSSVVEALHSVLPGFTGSKGKALERFGAVPQFLTALFDGCLCFLFYQKPYKCFIRTSCILCYNNKMMLYCSYSSCHHCQWFYFTYFQHLK